MKMFRFTMICLWALVLITRGTIQGQQIEKKVIWSNVGTMQLSNSKSSDSLIYMFPHTGSLRYGITSGNLHVMIKPNEIVGGVVDDTDSLTIIYKTLTYDNTDFATTPAADLADGTIIAGDVEFPLFTNVDWDSGSWQEYPNLTSVLYPYGPSAAGLLFIETWTTSESSDSMSTRLNVDEQ